jgi:hypothetical protein
MPKHFVTVRIMRDPKTGLLKVNKHQTEELVRELRAAKGGTDKVTLYKTPSGRWATRRAATGTEVDEGTIRPNAVKKRANKKAVAKAVAKKATKKVAMKRVVTAKKKLVASKRAAKNAVVKKAATGRDSLAKKKTIAKRRST